ncbi:MULTISPECIES: hypothetical protein [unclassified Bartonella]|uniref:hypothetical protein n=1 Tax=unclassified Bartonella TaxID=2645622 RepID=UPI0035CF0D05
MTVVSMTDHHSGHSQRHETGFDGHRFDFVSRIIGGNDYTYETAPAGSNWWTEWWRVIMNPISSHTCLGDAGPKCQKFYGTSHLEQKP